MRRPYVVEGQKAFPYRERPARQPERLWYNQPFWSPPAWPLEASLPRVPV